MHYAAVQTKRRLAAILQKKKEEAQQRKREEERKRQEAEEAKELKRIQDAKDKRDRNREALLVMCEQAIRSFGRVDGVTTTQMRKFFGINYTGKKIRNDLLSEALKQGLDTGRLKHGKKRNQVDINAYLLKGNVSGVVLL